MSPDTSADAHPSADTHRAHLVAVAHRMLGTVADAEDAVQEAYARWYRLSRQEQAAIEVPRAWLTRVTSRICLDHLGSARARREQYVGEWLPEPVPVPDPAAAADPAARAVLDDSVSTALLVVLESLSPAERVAFVLHDVFAVPFAEIAEVLGRTPAACRQLATAARRHVAEHRVRPVPRERRDAVVRAFAAACAGGDLARLTAVLHPDVVLRSDGGGLVSAARRPVTGARDVARFCLGVTAKVAGARVEEVVTGDGLAFVVRDGDTARAVLNLHVDGGRVIDVWITVHPGKLTRW